MQTFPVKRFTLVTPMWLWMPATLYNLSCLMELESKLLQVFCTCVLSLCKD